MNRRTFLKHAFVGSGVLLITAGLPRLFRPKATSQNVAAQVVTTGWEIPWSIPWNIGEDPPLPTSTPTLTPSVTLTPSATPIPSTTPTISATPTVTPSSTATPTATATQTPSNTPTPTPTPAPFTIWLPSLFNNLLPASKDESD